MNAVMIANALNFICSPSFLNHSQDVRPLFNYTASIDQLTPILKNSSECNNVCPTLECFSAAAHIFPNLDESEEPCENFYQFACGGWEARTAIPVGKNYISVFSIAEDDISDKIKSLLDKRLTGNETHFIRELKKTYDSCMDLPKIERLGRIPLKQVLRKLVPWPLCENARWKSSFSNWLDSLIEIRRLGYSHDIFIHLSVMETLSPDAACMIQLDVPTLGIDREHLLRGLNDNVTKVYFELMLKAAYILRKNDAHFQLIHHVNNRNLKNAVSEVFNFETKLANISESKWNRRTNYTVQELMLEVPEIDWLKYFNELLNIKITESERLKVMDTDYIKNFVRLINETDKRVVINYMMWRVVHESLPMLSKYWRTLAERSADTDILTEQPRWKYCLSVIRDNLGLALSSYYLRQQDIKEGSKEAALEIFKYIKQEILNILKNLYWMGKNDKLNYWHLINVTKASTALAKELRNDTFMSDFYRNLDLSDENFFKMLLMHNRTAKSLKDENFFFKMLMLRKWSTDSSFSRLRKNKLGEELKKHANILSVKYLYIPLGIKFELPAGILQQPFFDKDWPNYLNFGAIASMIGREMTYGLFKTGVHDGNGYWSKTAQKVFHKKSKCFVEQYDNYASKSPEFEQWVNSDSTVVENMADSAGLEIAYLAYQAWVNENQIEKKLPGLKYTPNQLFWISAANVLCEKQRKMNFKNSNLGGPPMFRVIGSMSNLPQFARDFKCPANTTMNRKNKCRIWNKEYED